MQNSTALHILFSVGVEYQRIILQNNFLYLILQYSKMNVENTKVCEFVSQSKKKNAFLPNR